MTLPWYPRDLGKYARDTKHLTMLEHGAYNLLLDFYYSTGPIPTSNALALLPDNSRVYRICSAVTREEQAAADNIINMFFTVNDGMYRNKKADQVIEEQLEKHKKRVNSGRVGGINKAANNPSNATSNATSNTPQKETKKEKEIREERKKEAQAPLEIPAGLKPDNFFLPDWVKPEDWLDFSEMRKKQRKPMTERAAKSIIKKLEQFRSQGHDTATILEQSIRNGWQDIYEPKGAGGNNSFGNQKGPNKSERAREAAMRGLKLDIGK